ncbi:ATP-binding protein [Spirillospora sp. CA-255316]
MSTSTSTSEPAMERLGDRLLLPGAPGSPGDGRAVRRAVRERAAKVVGVPDVLDDIELMTAEAVANAVLHGSGAIGITVATDGRRLRVEVRDGGPADRRKDPARRCVDHGRGLAVIDALSAEWALERGTGETRLWFVVDPSGGS